MALKGGRLRLAVVGTLAADPFAGMAWMHMQICGGLLRLGHDVTYLEATSRWPYDPQRNRPVRDSDYALPYLERVADSFGLGERWAYRPSYLSRDSDWTGPRAGDAVEILRSADAVLNVAGATRLSKERLEAGRCVYLGTDPGPAELGFAQGSDKAQWIVEEHDDVVSYGENIGSPDCQLPPLPRLSATTRQPVLVALWNGAAPARAAITTVANWRQAKHDIEYEGQKYRWSKRNEFQRFLELPERVKRPLELATGLVNVSGRDRKILESHGWGLRDAHDFTTDPWSYRDYIRSSSGEFTVAKDQNIRLRTGWFSERSACYLAAGRPVVTQDTGFSKVLPTGEGLFAVASIDEAAAALEEIDSDYERHSAAASEIAEDFFRAEKVLGKLLEDLGL